MLRLGLCRVSRSQKLGLIDLKVQSPPRHPLLRAECSLPVFLSLPWAQRSEESGHTGTCFGPWRLQSEKKHAQVHHHDEKMDEKGRASKHPKQTDLQGCMLPSQAGGLASDRLRPSLRGKSGPWENHLRGHSRRGPSTLHCTSSFQGLSSRT